MQPSHKRYIHIAFKILQIVDSEILEYITNLPHNSISDASHLRIHKLPLLHGIAELPEICFTQISWVRLCEQGTHTNSDNETKMQ